MTKYQIKIVNETNWCNVCALKVAPSQLEYIDANSTSLLEAAYDTKFNWSPYALYFEETMIGFAMIGAFRPEERYIWLDRFMIDMNYQGLGHSKPLLEKLLHFIKDNWPVDEIVLSLEADNTVAMNIYKQLGFQLNGMTDSNGEKLMVYSFIDR